MSQERAQSFFLLEKFPESLLTIGCLFQGLHASLQLSVILYLSLILSEANLNYSTFVNIKFHLPHVSLFKKQIQNVLECTRCKSEHRYLTLAS